MMRIPINPKHPEPRKIRKAVEALRAGEVIAYPTDTVYGLGCDITQKKAIDRVYEIKRMSRDQPLAFICPDLSEIARYAVVDNQSYRLMRALTPGPYCFILTSTPEVPRILHIDRKRAKKKKTVGIRVPDHPVPIALANELGTPIVSTSASWEGEALNDPGDIKDLLRGLALVLDAGYGSLEPSTVVDLTGSAPDVLREGLGPIDRLV